MSKRRLAATLAVRLVVMLVILGALLFAPAGTWGYWQAWLYLAVFFVPTLIISFYLLARDPSLLERRMQVRETERRQQIGQSLAGLLFFLGFIVAGFDHRHGWSQVPVALVLIADAAVLAGFLFVFRVFQENQFAGSTVRVESGQQVIATGPYALVRHPMYLGALPVLIFTPLALGSCWALLCFLPFPLWLILRLHNEEEVLLRDLPGYADYRNKVHWRLIPGVW